MLKNSFLLAIFLTLLIVIFGCSNASDQPLMPKGDVSDQIASTIDTIESLQGFWNVEFDTENLKADVIEDRNLMMHFSLRGMLPAPLIVVNSYDPVEEIIDIDVTISNPYSFGAYDIRLIIFTDETGHLLMNADDWTPLYDIAGGEDINPFVAYAKETDFRLFEGNSQKTENLLIHLPGGDPVVQFAIDGSYPGNCEEPYSISGFSQDTLYDTTGSSADVQVDIFNWKGLINSVVLSCSDISGDDLALGPISGTTWGGTFTNNVGATPGVYEGIIRASTTDSGTLHLYDKVDIVVTQSGGGVPSDPVLLNTVPGNFHGIDYDGEYLYGATQDIGFVVMEMSNPEDPSIYGSDMNLDDGNDVEVQGGFAYVADVMNGLLTYDISVPDDPLYMGSQEVFECWRLAIDGDYLYVAWIAFAIADISVPSSPLWVAEIYDAGIGFDIAIDGDYGYFAGKGAGLSIYNVATPSVPVRISGLSETGHLYALAKKDNYVYAFDEMSADTFFVIDVTDPYTPFIEASLPTGVGAKEVVISGDYAYLPRTGGGLIIIDISDPTSPSVLTEFESTGDGWDVVILDNMAYLANGSGGMQTIQLW